MVSVKRAIKVEEQVGILSELIVPGLGNRRIFRILLANACRYSCDDCPARAERDLPRHALEPARLARLFMTAFRRGLCDGLFVTSGIPKDAVRAMDRMLELVELLRVTHGYRGYLHVKALSGALPGQIEKLVRLVDRVSYSLEAPCRSALDSQVPPFVTAFGKDARRSAGSLMPRCKPVGSEVRQGSLFAPASRSVSITYGSAPGVFR